MRRFSIILLIPFLVTISCKEEEGPPSEISFSLASSIQNEEVGNAILELRLDRPASGDLTVNYEIGGSTQSGQDYTAPGFTVVKKGELTFQLLIAIIDDNVFEFDEENNVNFLELMEVTLTGVTGNGMLTSDATLLTHKVFIRENDQEPFLKIELSWEDVAVGGAGDVDMDLLFWFEQNPGSNEFQLAGNQFQQGLSSGTKFETLNLSSLNPDTNYGLTFLYFEGTATNLKFTVKFTVVGGTLLDGKTQATYTGNYTLANLNGDAFTTLDFELVQTYQKMGVNYPLISAIEIPSSGSRAKRPNLKIPDGVRLNKIR